MKNLIHIGNFEEDEGKSKVFYGTKARLLIDGKELAQFSAVDYSIGRDISKIHTLGSFDPVELVAEDDHRQYLTTKDK